MRRGREFFIDLAPPITPADAARFALNIRSLYASVYLQLHGTRVQREIHARDPMYTYEDQLQFECHLPSFLLQDQISSERISVGFLQAPEQDPDLIDKTLCRLKEITG